MRQEICYIKVRNEKHCRMSSRIHLQYYKHYIHEQVTLQEEEIEIYH